MSLENIYLLPRNIYIKISQASSLLPVITGLANYKRLTKPYRILLYFFIAAVGFEVQSSIVKVIFQTSMPGLHLYTLVEFFAFSYIYYHHFRTNSALRLFIGINMIIFPVVSIADAFYIHDILQLNSLSRTYASISLTCYALAYFYFLFQNDTSEYNSGHPMFWISVGALVYFGGNTLYFMLAVLFMRNHPIANIGLYIHDGLNIIANCLYAQAFRCFRTRKAA